MINRLTILTTITNTITINVIDPLYRHHRRYGYVIIPIINIQSRDIYIRHFQHGGVYARCFNFVYGKFKFKITLVFSKMTRHFDNIV